MTIADHMLQPEIVQHTSNGWHTYVITDQHLTMLKALKFCTIVLISFIPKAYIHETEWEKESSLILNVPIGNIAYK